MESNAGKLYSCPTCKKSYKTSRNFEKHVQSHGAPGVLASGEVTSGVVQIPAAQEFACRQCSKKYKTLRGLNKHQLTHVQAGVAAAGVCQVNNNVNPICEEEDDEVWPEEAILITASDNYEEVVSFFEEEDEEQEALLLASLLGTEDVQKDISLQETQKAKPKARKAPAALCSTCGSSFQTLEGYMRHRMSHAMTDSFAKAPSLEVIKEKARTICFEVAELIFTENINAEKKNEKQLQDFSCKVKEFSGSELLSVFLNSLCDSLYACFQTGARFMLPSQLRNAYLRGVAELLANESVKEKLRQELLNALECQDNGCDINFFLASFIRKFSQKVLAFIVHCMASGTDGPNVKTKYAVTKQSTESTDYKQIVYYIGGANVKSVLRCAWRTWGQNEECKQVINTLRSNFIITSADASSAPDAKFMEWTLSQDRGKLIKLSDKALSFFILLGAVVKPLEHFDGSLYVDEVIENISEHPPILHLWEQLIQDSLPKTVSFKLLHSLCEYFCNTWRSGIVKRRMAELHSSKQGDPQGTRGVAFRPKVVNFNVKS